MTDNMWGAQTFLHTIVRRLQSRSVGDSTDLRGQLSARALRSGRFPTTWNILLLGAPGCGKSSLIYTYWRSLTDATDNDTHTPPSSTDTSTVERLCIDWNFLEYNNRNSNFELDMEAFEEPTVLVRAEDEPHTHSVCAVCVQQEVQEQCSGIVMIDTPGIHTMGSDESNFVSQCIHGSVREGTRVVAVGAGEKGDSVVSATPGVLSYWAPRAALSLINPMGILRGSSSSSSGGLCPHPHVVALVCDMSLPSFQDMLDVDVYSDENWADKAPLLKTYHTMIDAAIEQGLEVFVILTHLDGYHKQFENLIVIDEDASLDKAVDKDSMLRQEGNDGGAGRRGGDIVNNITETPVVSGAVEPGLTSLVDLGRRPDSVDGVEGSGSCCNNDDTRLGEDMLGELRGIYLQLSQSLSFGGRDVPPDRMFVMENYRNAKRRTESRLALAAAEGLETMLDAADVYIQNKYNEEISKCIIS